MKPKELLKRKFRRQWSDLQFLILLELAQHGPMRFTDLVKGTGASESGVGNMLARPPVVDFIVRTSDKGRSIYELSTDGKQAMAEFFAPVAGGPPKPPPPSETLSFFGFFRRVLVGVPARGFLWR